MAPINTFKTLIRAYFKTITEANHLTLKALKYLLYASYLILDIKHSVVCRKRCTIRGMATKFPESFYCATLS
jgi:hypothetical protein